MFFVYKIPDAIGTIEADSGYHIHADFKIYGDKDLNGTSVEIDFYIPDYFEIEDYVHMHKGNKNVIHVHQPNITIGNFLFSLDGNGRLALEILDNILKIYVNDIDNVVDKDYIIQDLDKFLISNSKNRTELQQQFNSIEDNARLQ